MHIIPELWRTKQINGDGKFHTDPIGFYQIDILPLKLKEKVSLIIILKIWVYFEYFDYLFMHFYCEKKFSFYPSNTF